jgi:hypothetical protein
MKRRSANTIESEAEPSPKCSLRFLTVSAHSRKIVTMVTYFGIASIKRSI